MIATVGGPFVGAAGRGSGGRVPAGRDPDQRSAVGFLPRVLAAVLVAWFAGGWASSAWPNSWPALWSACRSTCEAAMALSLTPLAAAFILVVIRCAGLFAVVPLFGLPAHSQPGAHGRGSGGVGGGVLGRRRAGLCRLGTTPTVPSSLLSPRPCWPDRRSGRAAGSRPAQPRPDRPSACRWVSVSPATYDPVHGPSLLSVSQVLSCWRWALPWPAASTAKPWLGCAGRSSRSRLARPSR